MRGKKVVHAPFSKFKHELVSLLVKEGYLNPGVYVLTKDIVSMNTGETIAQENSKVQIDDFKSPYARAFGHNLYEVKHVLTKQNLYITNEDIKR